jgi:sRNA-binding protein
MTTLEKLKAAHPGLFCDRPFSIGLIQELMALHPDIPKKYIRGALGYYCNSYQYQRALAHGVRRINLDLSDGELPTDAEIQLAVPRLALIKSRMKEHKKANAPELAAQTPNPEIKPIIPVSPVAK